MSEQAEKGLKLDTYPWEEVRNPEAKWYKGDTHTHSALSDGNATREVLIDNAAEAGLDFFIATDHNVFPTSWVRKDVLVIPEWN